MDAPQAEDPVSMGQDTPQDVLGPSAPLTGPEAVPLAIIAGGGRLPLMLVEACQKDQTPFIVVGLEGQADRKDYPADWPQFWIKLGKSGEAAERLFYDGYRRLVMAGWVKRPSLTHLWPDWRTAKFLAKVGYAALGDDDILSAIVKELEAHGMAVISPGALLHSLASPPGLLSKASPDDMAQEDLQRALQVALASGQMDVGQGAVVQQGMVLCVEAVEGTDAMLARAGELKRKGLGGVLVKAAKPGQDRRLDMPTLGPRTVENAHKAGLRGIGFEGHGAILLDREEMIRLCDRHGLFLIGLEALDAAVGPDGGIGTGQGAVGKLGPAGSRTRPIAPDPVSKNGSGSKGDPTP
ncbi:MAG: LpxI family protein [Rhodospirillaceae bacterium]